MQRLRSKVAKRGRYGEFRCMQARYKGTCKCGALIQPGDKMHFDTKTHMALCYQCGRQRFELALQGLSLVETPNECDQLIDRLKRLKALPATRDENVTSEIVAITDRLRIEFKTHRSVRRLFSELQKCGDNVRDMIAISAKFSGYCFHCGSEVGEGELAFYNRQGRRLHCLNCDFIC